MVTQSMGYDASGNVTSTTLKSDTGSFSKTLKSSAAYTSNNNLVASVTDTANQKESYVYGTKQSVMTGQATAVRDAMGNTTTTTYDSKGRVTKKTLQIRDQSFSSGRPTRISGWEIGYK